MTRYGNILPDGSSVQDQPADGWVATLSEVSDAGFTELDPTDCWLRIADLSNTQLEQFKVVLRTAGLTVPGVSTVARSIAMPPAIPTIA